MTEQKTWTSNQTFEEWIESTRPTGKYDETVMSILQEEQNGGRFEWLRGNQTLFDIDHWRHQRQQKEFEEALVSKKQSIQSIQEKIQAEREKGQGEKKEKKEKPNLQLLEQYQTTLDGLYVDRFELEHKIRESIPLLESFERVIHCWKSYFISLRRVVALYKEKKDREVLRKGVHAISEYRDYLIGSHEEIVRRALLMEEYGTNPELCKLFDLQRIPLKVFYDLGELVKESRKRFDKRFLTEACMYYKTNHPEDSLDAAVDLQSSLEMDEEFETAHQEPSAVIQKEEEIESWADAAADADARLYRRFDRD
jgi:hypothetical protein